MADLAPWRGIPEEIRSALDDLVGRDCVLKRVSSDYGLSLGFERLTTNSVLTHGLWEFVTYYCSWRVISVSRVLCASCDFFTSRDEAQHAIDEIELGKFMALQQISDLDMRILLDKGICVDVLRTISDDDDTLNVFIPGKRVAVFSSTGEWTLKRSDVGEE